MRSIGADAARTRFYRLLDDAERGERVTITKRGVPVAMLVPIGDSRPDVDDLLRQVRSLRKGNTPGGLPIRDLIDEGRK
jgi:prevent-host-death family protein